ncbi:MAG: DNA-processing protein DprA [Atribacterota bacterium]|nr:DNA-processing protein DprA [Atribacterota bacterium]MDD4895780.1 DNA-processing protein DprA [Atribacterota bacterium]MDD5636372.1 DNA-processing protein DprA [Atribacterota bacterium]
MEKQELKYWLAWNRVKEIGPVRFLKLWQHFSSLEEAWNCNIRTNNMMNLLHIGEEILNKIEQEKQHIDPEQEWDLLQKRNIKVITIKDEGYPSLLKNIYSPPPVIYYQGDFVTIMKQSKGIAIVGSRKATYYGRKVAREIASEITKSGYVVISGLAKGIDTNAHLGALEANGLTIAVLGSGIDRIYPPENRSLAHRIIEKGAVVTEFPIFTKPEKNNFPRRNRIISGLALGTLVIEAGEKSGALITADYALEQGREVFAVPGSVHSFLSTGCHNLIKQGAKLVNSYHDILEEFQEENKLFSEREKTEDRRPNCVNTGELTDYEQNLLQYISIEPLHIDEITELTALPYGKISEVLLSLELKNIIREIEGKRYIRI